MNKEYEELFEKTKEYKRSDYVKRILVTERTNAYLEKIHKELIKFIDDEIYDIDRRIELLKEKMDTEGGYTMRMYLVQQKNALVKVSKKIFELERD